MYSLLSSCLFISKPTLFFFYQAWWCWGQDSAGTSHLCQLPPVRGRWRETGRLNNKEEIAPSCLFMELSGSFLSTCSFSKRAHKHLHLSRGSTFPQQLIQFAALPALGEPASLYLPALPRPRHQCHWTLLQV